MLQFDDEKSVRTSSRDAKIKYLVNFQFSCGTCFFSLNNEKLNVAMLRGQIRKQLRLKKITLWLLSAAVTHLVRAVLARWGRTTGVNHNTSSVIFFKNPNISEGWWLHPLQPTCGHHLPVAPLTFKFHPQSLLLSLLICFSHCKPRPLSHRVRVGSKVCDLVLKSSGDLLEAEGQLFVLGCWVFV